MNPRGSWRWSIVIAGLVSFGASLHFLFPCAVDGRPAESSSSTVSEATDPKRYAPTQQELESSYQRAQRVGQSPRRVYKDRITPRWLEGSTQFWYRNDLRGGKEFVLVNAERGTRTAAFDHEKLAIALSQATAATYEAKRLPFDEIDFVEDGKAIRFKIGDTSWSCDLISYECTKAESRDKPEACDKLEPRNATRESRSVQDGLTDDWTNDDELSTIESPWSSEPSSETEGPTGQQGGSGRGQRGEPLDRSPRSPDGKWTAFIRDGNVFVRSRDDNMEIPLTEDGKDDFAYGMLQWSPDSETLVAFRIEPGERKEVYLIESSPRDGGRAKLHSRPYALPGDKFNSYELNLFPVRQALQPGVEKGDDNRAGKPDVPFKAIRPEVDRIDFGGPRVRWNRDGHTFTYQQTDRGHQRFRLIEVDARTGAARNVIDEKTATFIWTAHTENVNLSIANYMESSDEIIYASERDGWRHLYLIDARPPDAPSSGSPSKVETPAAPSFQPSPPEGRGRYTSERANDFACSSDFAPVKNQITKGEYVVRGIDRIDEEKRQIWFRASGMNPDQDPYFIHYYCVNFDGTGLIAITEGNGTHSIQYSPDRRYVIDTYSRVDLPPVHELRRVADGKLVCKLEEADIGELVESGWEPPQVFVAKGRDAKTDIWGIICRPRKLDPAKKYPIIEQVYAGPQGSFVPKSFRPTTYFGSLTELGFIVVQCDGMGTANRSKAFHDVCWHNLQDGGFPDRKLWIKSAAAKYPHMDVTRIGVTGNSAGGQNALSAVLCHPDFYKVSVASCGCHDNRMDKASWNEQWMGYPVGPQYAECSNVTNAHKLEGKLLLIVGEMDTNVPPESTLRVVDALIKAGKDFDLLVIPGGGHGMGGAYGQRRMQDFFVRHLLGIEPPDRNAETGRKGG